MTPDKPQDTKPESGTIRHLLNCRGCDWYDVVEGPSMLADVARENHEEGIRNWRSDKERCPKGSVAWVFLGEDSEVTV